MAAEAVNLRLRLIDKNDRSGVVALLREGFPRRSVAYWEQAWDRLIMLEKPEELNQLGHVIDVGGRIVGVILIITARALFVESSKKRANLSSWYVHPDYRSYAAMLLSRACKDKTITFLNVSAAVHTYPICEALGFVRYSEGQMAAIPVLSKKQSGVAISRFSNSQARLSDSELKMMVDHENYGCICLVGTTAAGQQPFIFVKRRIKGFLPAAQLVFSRSNDEFRRFAHQIGLYLAARGIVFVILDSSAPIEGLKGKYYPGRSPKYFKGPQKPNIGDLAYTEIAVLGI
jgi:hypothetical protein